MFNFFKQFDRESRKAKERKRGYEYGLQLLTEGRTVDELFELADNVFDKTEFDYGIQDCAFKHRNVKFGVLEW